ncbi:hypothetical protein AMS59_02725 [Lysinibacillus sp. FJAT-14745]|nr:hypothetical protein AMS59_02725 [Lysinibacillus sp. FJAT-14745]
MKWLIGVETECPQEALLCAKATNVLSVRKPSDSNKAPSQYGNHPLALLKRQEAYVILLKFMKEEPFN